MKRLYFLIVCTSLFFLQAKMYAQDCLSGGISFYNQMQIDEFPLSYPDCTEISGDVRISGNDIVNVDGLHNITSIKGYLIITDNDNLNNLTGLSSLTTIERFLLIRDNRVMTTLSGLDALGGIGTFLELIHNNSLRDIGALSQITAIPDDIKILGNQSLQTLTGLHNLARVGKSLEIGNTSLLDLNGLSSLNYIGASLSILNNDALVSLKGLENLNSLSRITVNLNDNIETLEGIDNIKNFTKVEMQFNPKLAFCATENICAHLSNGGSVTLRENGTGCNSIFQITSACNSLGTNVPLESEISVYPTLVEDLVIIEGIDGPTTLCILDIAGTSVRQFRTLEKTIDLSDLQSGPYFMEIKTQTSKSIKRIIKT